MRRSQSWSATNRNVAQPLAIVSLSLVICLLLTVPAALAETYESVCPPPAAGHAACQALRPIPKAGTSYSGSGEGGGYSPSDLASAYSLPTSNGTGQTVAIVDAYDDPNAESDLKTYRAHYGLSECTTSDGCFKKVNQTGGSTYPSPESGWSEEISLDQGEYRLVAPITVLQPRAEGFDPIRAHVV